MNVFQKFYRFKKAEALFRIVQQSFLLRRRHRRLHNIARLSTIFFYIE